MARATKADLATFCHDRVPGTDRDMTNQLAKRALGAGFAAALLLGAAACGDDDDDVNTEEIEQDAENLGEEGGDEAEQLGDELEQEGDELEE